MRGGLAYCARGVPGFTGRGAGLSPVAIAANTANLSVVPLGGGAVSIEKTGAVTGAYDASAISAVIKADFVLRLKRLAGGGGIACGMSLNPLVNDSYASINRTWVFATPSWYVYEGSTQIGAALADQTYGWIWRIGTALNWGRGLTLPAAAAAPDRTVVEARALGFDSSLRDIGDKMEVLLIG